jgi:general secretion pathway protein F
MPNFTYRAYDQRGKLIEGDMEASSRKAVLASLHGKGSFPLEIVEAVKRSRLRWWEREVFGGSAMPAAALTLFTRELSTLVKADLPVDEVLRIIAVQPLLPARIRRAANEIHNAVRGGASLAQSLANRGTEFPEYYWRLIQAGETSGSLADTLEDLAAFLDRAGETRAKLMSALAYPAVLFAAACAAVTIVMTVLLPTIVPLFKDQGASPPAALQFLINLQDFTRAHWLVLLVALVGVAVLALAALRSAEVRDRLDRIVLRLPVAGRLLTARETARFARTFATLSRNGVPIVDTLRLTASVMRNRAFMHAVTKAGDSVTSGDRLSEPLLQSGVFPELALRLTSVGEQTGQLDTMLMHVAVVFEAALQRQTSQLLTLLTPVLTLLIGGSIGGLILVVMNAILSVNDLASP